MHVKLCRLASEKHRFGPKMVSEATSYIASKFQKISGGGMPPDPPSCCVAMRAYARTTNLTTPNFMATALAAAGVDVLTCNYYSKYDVSWLTNFPVFKIHYYTYVSASWPSTITGLDWWTGLVD